MPGGDENHATAGAGPAGAAAGLERARWALGWALLALVVVLAATVAVSITAGATPTWAGTQQVAERLLWPVMIACELVGLAHIATSVGLYRAQRREQETPTA